ncbi:LacI family DNA-binding transcriptional regulator [Ruania alkalisoli]|uniref:LacI family DNA-binding transcriptional regulator n=1 Tax=Ruania alkalisoli TaxID=2779775 RepID=A0A7M1STG1_9MICO|nr:LacI family DNA-binding transcriptional regulator [Ruania alkalisoli]QOR69903.1 LacI family DNA-binding transcriptional regulator [Ruania alkalisoli]
MKRPTIRDIAHAAGVSPGAVSFALNDQPGVSEATRARVRKVADEIGWQPSAAARALSNNRAQAVGLVITRPTDTISNEGFYLRFIAGVEHVLTRQHQSLLLQMVQTEEEERLAHARWWSGKHVDGVILTDPREQDDRPAALAHLGLPCTVVGVSTACSGLAGVGSVVTDDAKAMRRVVEHLHETGRHRVAHVAGLSGLVHVETRRRAFRDVAAEEGLDVVASWTTDFTEDAGRHATAEVLRDAGEEHVDAIVFDNELLALGGLVAVHDAGLRVPEDVALVSFEDSPVCRVVSPPLTALYRDPADLGRMAAEALLATIETGVAQHLTAPAPSIVPRGSTSG